MRRWPLHAAASAVKMAGSTSGASRGSGTVASATAVVRSRNLAGSPCSSLASARNAVSSKPVTVWLAAVRRPTATATASSSSSSNGGQATVIKVAGGGDFVFEYSGGGAAPAPVTTIAWRLAHIIVPVFGERSAAHFGGPAVDFYEFGYAGTAAQALGQLDHAYPRSIGGLP